MPFLLLFLFGGGFAVCSFRCQRFVIGLKCFISSTFLLFCEDIIHIVETPIRLKSVYLRS